MLTSAAQGLHDFVAAWRVAQGDGDVSKPAFVAQTQDGTAGHACAEFLFSPGKELNQSRPIQTMTWAEILFPAGRGKAVPGTDELAVVTTVDAVAHERAQRQGNGTRVFDGEV